MQKREHPLNRDGYFNYNIMLGSACNWKCPYCIQTEQPIKQADPNHFCDLLIDHLKRTNRYDKVYSFSFWGGEPLLYFDSLKVIIERLSAIPLRHPMRVSSNGSLLTEENYKLFNKYKVRFEVSYHEGRLTDDKWKIALKIENFCVSSLITHKVLDWEFYRQQWEHLYRKFGRCVKWGVFPVISAGRNSSEYSLSKEDIDTHFGFLYKHLNELNNTFYNYAYNALLYSMYSKGLYKYGNKCFNERCIDIDLYGNQYFCHHDYSPHTKVGNIFTRIPIMSREYPKISEECKNCSAFKFCTGGCLRCEDRNNECYYYKKLYQLFEYMKKNHKIYMQSKGLESL